MTLTVRTFSIGDLLKLKFMIRGRVRRAGQPITGQGQSVFRKIGVGQGQSDFKKSGQYRGRAGQRASRNLVDVQCTPVTIAQIGLSSSIQTLPILCIEIPN